MATPDPERPLEPPKYHGMECAECEAEIFAGEKYILWSNEVLCLCCAQERVLEKLSTDAEFAFYADALAAAFGFDVMENEQ